jgi:hypothetical protein
MIMPDAESKLQEAAHHSRDRPDLCLERAEVRECLARAYGGVFRDYPTDVTYLVWIVIDGISNEELHKHRGGTEGATREYKSQLMKKARKIFAECYSWHRERPVGELTPRKLDADEKQARDWFDVLAGEGPAGLPFRTQRSPNSCERPSRQTRHRWRDAALGDRDGEADM